MDKKTQYIIGGVAIIGIIAYLYNKKKTDEATKITNSADAPLSNSEIINSMVVETMVNPDTGLITPPVVDEPNPIVDTNVIINPDGTWVDTSLVSITTNPNTSTSSSMTTPSKVGSTTTTTTSSSTPSKVTSSSVIPTTSTTSSSTPSKVTSSSVSPTTSTTTAVRFDGGFQYADGCGVDPVLGF